MSLLPNEVKTEHIANGAITTPKIADEQITSDKLKDGAVKTEKLATGAITGSKLADNAVTGSKIRDGVIRSEKIASGAVTTAKIGEGQVTGSRLQDRAVTTEKLANNAVTTQKIANASVTPAKLSFVPPSVVRPITPAISTDEIADGAVTQAKLDPALSLGERHYFLEPSSVEVFRLGEQSEPLSWRWIDLSEFIPVGTKAIMCELGMYTEEKGEDGDATFQVRKYYATAGTSINVNAREAKRTDYNAGIVPIGEVRGIDYQLELAPEIRVTFWITLVGYIK